MESVINPANFNISTYIIIITCLVSFLAFQNREIMGNLMHIPYLEKRDKSYYRWLTNALVHSNEMHLILNMFVLYMLGEFAEKCYISEFGYAKGRLFFLLLYVLAAIVSCIPSYIKNADNSYYSALGASGATSAVTMIVVIFAPWAKFYIYGIVPIYAIVFAVLYIAYEWYNAKTEKQDNIGHDAHLWGAIFGFVFTFIIKPDIYQDFIDRLIYQIPF